VIKRRELSLAIGLGAVLSLLIAAPAMGAGKAGVVSHAQSLSSEKAADFWTPERMREAITVTSPKHAAAIAAGQVKGETVDEAESRAAPTDFETSPALDLLYPQRVHGKLFFEIAGTGAACSATVATSAARNVILTAGHCVATPGPAIGQVTFSQNVIFVPAYRNGAAPFGIFPATNLRTPTAWAIAGDITFDFGAANVASPSGLPIQDTLGSRGVSFNRLSFKGQTFMIYGYPGEPAEFYDGERLILCVSPFQGIERDTRGVKAGPCRQQQGSSGGAFLLSNGLINSVVSHGGCAVPSTLCTTTVGTYLSDFAFNAYAAASGGIPRKLKKRIKRCIKKHKKFAKEQRCLNRAETFQPVVL
jgi:hypothetical protein